MGVKVTDHDMRSAEAAECLGKLYDTAHTLVHKLTDPKPTTKTVSLDVRFKVELDANVDPDDVYFSLDTDHMLPMVDQQEVGWIKSYGTQPYQPEE